MLSQGNQPPRLTRDKIATENFPPSGAARSVEPGSSPPVCATAGVCCPRAAALLSCTRRGARLKALGHRELGASPRWATCPPVALSPGLGRGVSAQRGSGKELRPLASGKAATTCNWVNPPGPPCYPSRCRPGEGGEVVIAEGHAAQWCRDGLEPRC